MYSLVTLDVSCNLIADIDEVDHVAGLPCLEELILTGNQIAGIVGEFRLIFVCFSFLFANGFFVRFSRLSATRIFEVR